jgi:hypothetical protein
MKGFVFRLIPPRADFAFTMTEDERATMLRHVAYCSNLAAELVRDGDPAQASPHGFRTEISPMLSLVTPAGRFDAF